MEGQRDLHSIKADDAPKTSVLAEATQLVFGERMRNYGHPYQNQVILKKLWEGIFGIELTFTQVNFALMGLKMCRELTSSGHRDNIVDIAGYAEILNLVLEAEKDAEADSTPS